jgi:YbbR domain-containing protein
MKGMANSGPGGKRPAKAISKEWLLKLVSIFLAVLLWYYVGGEDTVDKSVMIPIEIINLPRDLVISNQFKKEIEVTVSGPRSLILDMANRAVTRQIDLSAAVPGTMVIENSNRHIPVPRGITVQRVQPSSLILSLDKLIQKAFPVTAKTSGQVADGYYLKSLKTDPDVITITGPSTILKAEEDLKTKVIDIEGIKESTQQQVPLDLDPAIVELIGETSVTADLVIGLETHTKTLTGVKVHVVIDGVLRKVMPATVKVVANIPSLLLDRESDLEKLLSVTAMQSNGEGTLKVTVIPRPDVELPVEILAIIPSTVLLVSEDEPISGYPMGANFLKEVNSVTLADSEPQDVTRAAEKKVGPELKRAGGSPPLIRALKKKKLLTAR